MDDGIGDVTTAYNTMPITIATVVNIRYAVINESCPSICFPRLEDGALSSPIVAVVVGNTTESFPVPKVAPTAIRRQNSYVAIMNGITPMMNTRIVISWDNIPILSLSVMVILVVAVSESNFWKGLSVSTAVIMNAVDVDGDDENDRIE